LKSPTCLDYIISCTNLLTMQIPPQYPRC